MSAHEYDMPCDSDDSQCESDSAPSLEQISDGEAVVERRAVWPEDVLPSDFDLREKVTSVIVGDKCERKCLRGKAAPLEKFFISIMQMSGEQRKSSALTALAVLMESEAACGKRQRGKGVRKRFKYHLPFIGDVCRQAFCDCYLISIQTVARYRARIREGRFNLPSHGGRKNKNGQSIDLHWLTSWYRYFASVVGDVVFIYLQRRQSTMYDVHGVLLEEQHTLLPCHFTWARLHTEMCLTIENSGMKMNKPSESSFRRILEEHCSEIHIRSRRVSDCDICAIYMKEMKSSATISLTELLGQHSQAAKAMRYVLHTVDSTHII